jgi:hypothetical protein
MTIRSDNTSDFNDYKTWTKTNKTGTQFKPAASYTKEQNGQIERFIYYII